MAGLLADLYEVIAERVDGLARFASVAPALSSTKRPSPAAELWLAEDLHVVDRTGVMRQLTWVIKVTVGHQDLEGAAQQEMHGHLDALRDAFAGWRPDDCIGIQQAFSVPLVKIESYQDHGPAVYLVSLAVRVFPEVFARTT